MMKKYSMKSSGFGLCDKVVVVVVVVVLVVVVVVVSSSKSLLYVIFRHKRYFK